MKHILKKLLLKPPHVKWCSQTIYQSLLGTIKLYEFTNEKIWEERSDKLLNILLEIQQADGGFDIGYDFNFGMLHKKGESTSPEMVGLLAMLEYGRVFGFSKRLNECCRKAVVWIVNNSIKINDQEYYIPYAPYSTNKVMVYNGTSFVCGALGYYIGLTGINDKKLNDIYNGMITYLYRKLTHVNDKGSFWYYYDQDRQDINPSKKLKIDNYHQMQQVEMHAYSQYVYPNELQLKLINKASKYVINIFNKEGTVPYTNNIKDFGGGIHLWGFSSILSALSFVNHKEQLVSDYEINNLKRYVFNFIIKNGWNGEFFYPILDKNGSPILKDYMVRSDAWVFNSLSSLLSDTTFINDRQAILDVLTKCYVNMESVNFSGKETHASTKQTRLISSIINKFK